MALVEKARARRGTVIRFGSVLLFGLVTIAVLAVQSRTPGYIACTTRSIAPQVQVAEGEVAGGFRLAHLLSLEQATSAAFGSDGTMIATSKEGRVVVVDDSGSSRDVLDLSGEVMSDGFEQGLFDAAVSPDGGRLYLSYTDLRGDLHVIEYAWGSGAPDIETRRSIIVVDQPDDTHNGGGLLVGPDGMLWVSVGDGQAASFDDFDDWGNALAAQDTSNLYGSILRIDPEPSGSHPYSIPPDNPFVGTASARDEIWTYGLRNPWRFSLDPSTGDLWIADVGQHCWEEINRLSADESAGAGANLGWPALEGTHRYRGDLPDHHFLPVFEYSHGEDRERCSVVGGHVYRGHLLPELQGSYLFSDSCDGRLWALSLDGRKTVTDLGVSITFPVSLGVTPNGEIVVVSLVEGVYLLERDAA